MGEPPRHLASRATDSKGVWMIWMHPFALMRLMDTRAPPKRSNKANPSSTLNSFFRTPIPNPLPLCVRRQKSANVRDLQRFSYRQLHQ